MRIYLVGGAVRDLLMGLAPRDRDFVVLDATEEEFLAAYPRARRIGRAPDAVYLVGRDEYTLSRHASIGDDLHARDLTVNAMAKEGDGVLAAHPDARKDLEARLLRPVRVENFRADPLRTIRAARFAACLPEFAVTGELLTAMRAGMDGLAGVAAERVGLELRKALACRRPGNFLRTLVRAGCLRPWFAELADIPTQAESVVLDALAGNPTACWMSLCLAVGHAERAETLARRLALPDRLVQAGRLAALYGARAEAYPALSAPEKVEVVVGLSARGLLPTMAAVVQARTGQDFVLLFGVHHTAVRAVHLPPEDRDKGTHSADKLRELRVQALSRPLRRDEARAGAASAIDRG